jgi:hypothetical protein
VIAHRSNGTTSPAASSASRLHASARERRVRLEDAPQFAGKHGRENARLERIREAETTLCERCDELGKGFLTGKIDETTSEPARPTSRSWTSSQRSPK